MIARSLLLLPRLYLGTIFLVAAYSKLTIPIGFTRALTGFLNAVALQSASPGYKGFVQSVVLAHAGLFATLVMAGEVVAAVSLLLGLATRLGAAIGILLLVNYFLAKGLPVWSPASNDAADIVLCVLVIAGAAGRAFGVDRVLAKRFPSAVLW